MKQSFLAFAATARNLLFFACLLGLLAACAPYGNFGPYKSAPGERGVTKSGVSIVGVNHSRTKISYFGINGGGGDRAPQRWPSSGTVCCVMIPDVWTPGLVGKVTWKPNGEPYRSKIVPIERYTETGTIYVHFFDNEEVRVVVANVGATNPEHPIPWVPLPCEPMFKRDENGVPLNMPGVNCPPPRED